MQPRQRASQFLFYDIDHLTNRESEGATPKRSFGGHRGDRTGPGIQGPISGM